MHDELLQRHLELVIEANSVTNITRITSWDEGMLLHVKDSLEGLTEILTAPEGKYADLGTGAGYPGIPLAIETGRETLLVDAVKKKTDILDSIISELGLKNVSTYHGRIEDLAREQYEAFSVVTARALAQISVLMEYASPLLCMHGRLICYKARIEDNELQHALSLQKKIGLKLVSDREIDLDGNIRRIICFEKISKPEIRLPRKAGMALKRPL